MRTPLSGACWVRNFLEGAFCLPESLCMLLPVTDDFLIVDVGSDDGSWDVLQSIARINPRVRVVRGEFSEVDAAAYSKLANLVISKCRYDHVLYYEPDQVFHEDLVRLMVTYLNRGIWDLKFWCIQFRENFQRLKWGPHPFHHVGPKSRLHFRTDGIRTDEIDQATMCSDYTVGHFQRWDEYHENTHPSRHREEGEQVLIPYIHQMVTDLSQTGGFRDHVPARRRLHAPFFHEAEDMVEGLPVAVWREKEGRNPNWTKSESPFPLPKILKYHIGKTKYVLRPDLLEALRQDAAQQYLDAIC